MYLPCLFFFHPFGVWFIMGGGDGWGGHPTRGFTPPPNIYRTFGAFIKSTQKGRLNSHNPNIYRTFGAESPPKRMFRQWQCCQWVIIAFEAYRFGITDVIYGVDCHTRILDAKSTTTEDITITLGM